MKTYTPCPWSKSLANMTKFGIFICVSAIAVITVIYFTAENLTSSDKTHLLIILGIIVVLFALVAAFMPRGVTVDDEQIIVHKGIGKIVIPRSDIKSIKPFPKDAVTLRLFGIGGIGGYVGLYRNSQIGNFAAFMTDPSRSYIIYRRSKRPIVITSVEKLQ
ncbi:MAG: hypothetical protein IJQ32_07590 [Paludibacteraceae bacterium]|nr:hypothetical protein [Paludibacteraceae bacterium]